MVNLTRSEYSREEVLLMVETKEKIEAEIANLMGILHTNSVGMSGPLVDEDGFPRNDIDVYQVRHARHRIICLQNDHKDIMKKIEAGLSAVFERERTVRENGDADVNMAPAMRTHCDIPFAMVNLVHAGSPAHIAGISEGDLILEFGSVNGENFSALQAVRAVVEHSINQKVTVVVKRSNSRVRLQLTPQAWAGQGLLGCNLMPIPSVDR